MPYKHKVAGSNPASPTEGKQMLELLLFIFVCYGMTQILVYGSIFERVRPKYKFFHCSMCVGFWVGILVYGLFSFVEKESISECLHGWFWIKAFLAGCLSSGTSYALCSMFGDDGININHGG